MWPLLEWAPIWEAALTTSPLGGAAHLCLIPTDPGLPQPESCGPAAPQAGPPGLPRTPPGALSCRGDKRSFVVLLAPGPLGQTGTQLPPGLVLKGGDLRGLKGCGTEGHPHRHAKAPPCDICQVPVSLPGPHQSPKSVKGGLQRTCHAPSPRGPAEMHFHAALTGGVSSVGGR